MKNNNNNNNERSGNSSSTSSSSKKGKNKSNNNNNNNNSNSEKPRQPQRGLGVAQLEKIRLHTQLASVGIFPHHQVLPYPSAFLNSSFQHVPEEMRIQAGYQAALQSSLGGAPPPPPPPFCYPPPSVLSSSYGYHHPNNYMMGMGEHMERASNIRYAESQSYNTARWNPNNNVDIIRETQQYPQQSGMVTRHLLSHVEQNPKKNNFFESMSSSNQNSEPSGNDQEMDLELRL